MEGKKYRQPKTTNIMKADSGSLVREVQVVIMCLTRQTHVKTKSNSMCAVQKHKRH